MQEIKRDINTNILRLYPILDVTFVIIITLLFYLNTPVYSKSILKVPKGSTKSTITYLQNEGYNISSFDKKIIDFIGYPQSGWITINKPIVKKYDFLYQLCKSKAAMANVTLIPGETKYFFFKEISKKLKVNTKRLNKYYDAIAPYPDGVIIPNTYKFPIGMPEEEIIKKLIQDSTKFYKKLSLKIFGNYYEKEWFRYITIASIIQKEAANNKEMPIVASVVYNRLKKRMKLQMDGTLNYGKYSHTKVTPYRIRNDRSHFNTYKYRDIPKYPVSSVSFEAIKSAIFPAKTDYLYFVKNSKGSHSFSKSYKQHLRNIKSGKN
jgi:UPF0755 protein